MKKDRQLVILLAALLVLIFLSSCAAGKNASMTPAATDCLRRGRFLKQKRLPPRLLQRSRNHDQAEQYYCFL